nr:radical SAM protein [Nitrospiraceae bacterium]
MKIAFVQFLYYEYLGIMYLSACLKERGHDVEVFIAPEGKGTEGFARELAAAKPDVVAFSVMSGSEEMALSIARELRKRSPIYTVMGGPHVTASPEIITNDGVDCVCLGEAERSLAAVVDSLAAGAVPREIAGAWFNIDGEIVRNDVAPLVRDLGTVPHPDRALYRDKYRPLRRRRAAFISGRGCPYGCSFCSIPSVRQLFRGKGPFVRQRSVADVIAEMREVRDVFGITTAYFEDDIFIMDRDWVLEFCEVYPREVGLPFSCHIRADRATDEVIGALARAKCTNVSFGIETGGAERREVLLHKEVSDRQIAACAALLRKHGIRFRTLNMLGLPGESLADAFRTVDLNARIDADYPWCSLFQPLPGTELWDRCIAENLFEGGAPL